ncbi:MAG TPA: NYN domain-containing protein [Solirubrobacteraceae bacterium]|nr:NYN domain-containing protein [Solirubrobacteraceae bacterium]
MPGRLIVDGNNVMGSHPDGWWKDRAGAARRLVERIGAWADATGADVVVVFDGRPPSARTAPPGVEVRYAERGGANAADDVIAALVADDAAPAELRVVTSDAELARRVREHGAEVIGARGFRDRLGG